MLNNLYEMFKKWSYVDGIHKNSVWVYSDTHFNEEDMKHLRKNYIGDDEQIKRINSKVGKNDTIIILGDVGDLNFVKKIKGYKVLIMGNHEKGASNYKRKIEQIKYFNSEDMSQQDAEQFKINGLDMLLYPDRFKELLDKNSKIADKYAKFKNEDNHLFDEVYEGPLMVNDRLILSHEPIQTLPSYMFNIHGHDHAKWFNSDHHMNVCAEHINYTPVNLISLLKNGLLKNIDSIHRTAIDNAIERKKKRQGNKND